MYSVPDLIYLLLSEENSSKELAYSLSPLCIPFSWATYSDQVFLLTSPLKLLLPRSLHFAKSNVNCLIHFTPSLSSIPTACSVSSWNTFFTWLPGHHTPLLLFSLWSIQSIIPSTEVPFLSNSFPFLFLCLNPSFPHQNSPWIPDYIDPSSIIYLILYIYQLFREVTWNKPKPHKD